MDKINVISIQITPKKADSQYNCDKINTILQNSEHKKYDLIVMPEFFNAGINLTNEEFFKYAEKPSESIVLKNMSETAKKYSSYIVCGSILVNDKEKCLNRSYLLDRKGNIISKYDKIHLFNYLGGNEGSYTYPGEQLKVIQTDFGKIGFGICFDIRFPEHFLKLTRMGAEIFVLPASWLIANNATPEFKAQFIKNWQIINTARALDNAAYLISANNTGELRPYFNGIGHSMIVDFEGKILAQNDEITESYIYAELDLKALRAYRKNFPVQNF